MRRPNTPQIVAAVIVACYLLLALQQAGQPFIVDEVDYPRLAEAISETGRPIFYRGEESAAHLGTVHPPLYAYTLGTWIQLVGYSEFAVRLLGVLLMLGTAWLGLRILSMLDARAGWGAPVFLALFLLHPFVLQSALLPDVDGTVLLFATVLVTHEVARLYVSKTEGPTRFLPLGLALGLAFASKLTSFPLVALVFMSVLVMWGLKRAVLTTLGVTVVGVVSFLAWWFMVATVTRVPFATPFEFTIRSGLKGGAGDLTISEAFARVWPPTRTTVYWLGVLLPLLMVWGTVGAVRRWRPRSLQRLVLPMALWAIGSYALYSVVSGAPFGFPKYYISAMPMMAMVAAVPVSRLAPVRRLSSRGWWTVSTAGVSVMALCFIDASSSVRRSLATTYPVFPTPNWGLIATLVVGSFIVVGWSFGFQRRNGRAAVLHVAYMALVLVLIASNLGQDLFHRTLNQESSIRYFPGEVGFEATVKRMQQLVDPDDPFLAPKDIGSATYNRYHEVEQLFRDPVALQAVLSDPAVTYAVVRTKWDYSYLVFPEAQQAIESHMVLIAQIGDFLIYEKPESRFTNAP